MVRPFGETGCRGAKKQLRVISPSDKRGNLVDRGDGTLGHEIEWRSGESPRGNGMRNHGQLCVSLTWDHVDRPTLKPRSTPRRTSLRTNCVRCRPCHAIQKRSAPFVPPDGRSNVSSRGTTQLTKERTDQHRSTILSLFQRDKRIPILLLSVADR